MMLVDSYIAPSTIEGVGIFAAVDIPAGARIWSFDHRFDQIIPVSEVAAMAEPLRRFIDRYGYPLMSDPNFIVLEADNGRFMNHSERPNTDFRHQDFGYALVDIAAGTEITCDYREFEPEFRMQPGRRFVAAGNAAASHA